MWFILVPGFGMLTIGGSTAIEKLLNSSRWLYLKAYKQVKSVLHPKHDWNHDRSQTLSLISSFFCSPLDPNPSLVYPNICQNASHQSSCACSVNLCHGWKQSVLLWQVALKGTYQSELGWKSWLKFPWYFLLKGWQVSHIVWFAHHHGDVSRVCLCRDPRCDVFLGLSWQVCRDPWKTLEVKSP